MNAELSDHLGYEPGGKKPEEQSNHRNGFSGKTVITDEGPLRIEVPRDREGSFEPLLIGKHERRFTGFDQKIISIAPRRKQNRVDENALLSDSHATASHRPGMIRNGGPAWTGTLARHDRNPHSPPAQRDARAALRGRRSARFAYAPC